MEEIDDLWGAHTDRTFPFIGVLVGLIGVALGAPLIMVLLVALTAAGLTVIIAKARG